MQSSVICACTQCCALQQGLDGDAQDLVCSRKLSVHARHAVQSMKTALMQSVALVCNLDLSLHGFHVVQSNREPALVQSVRAYEPCRRLF